MLKALHDKGIVGGSSAGAMNQPRSEILITGYSAESHSAVRAGTVFHRGNGNFLLESDELVDVYFSERGRQGRLMVLAMGTPAEAEASTIFSGRTRAEAQIRPTSRKSCCLATCGARRTRAVVHDGAGREAGYAGCDVC